MSTHTRPSPAEHAAGDALLARTPRAMSRRPDRPGTLGRVTAVSLGVGAVSALVLPMVVFAGSAEHVVTGTALLGLALGWALLALLSVRRTTRPQRWAFVPAVTLAAAGGSLLLLAPGDGALTRSGWVWPPAMLALAVWTAARARRSLHTRARAWVVYPALALLAAAAVGGGYQTVRVTADAARFPMPGASYDVGGHDLHLVCSGQGAPTVVLEYGLGGTSSSWGRVLPGISGTNRVCAYDRAGQAWSDADDEPHDGVEIAADLHALLLAAGEPGPYVMAGHSSGGVYAMTYAAQYPDDVAGLVLLDATNPYGVTATSKATTVPAAAAGPLGVLPTLARTGLLQVLPTGFWSALPEPDAARYRAHVTTARSVATSLGEVSEYPAAFTQAQALTTLGDTPLVVVTTSDTMRAGGARAAAQERFARLSTNSSLRAVGSSHAGLLDEASGARHSVRAIRDTVRAVRTGATLTND